MFKFKEKIYFKDWVYDWLLKQKNYIKESTYANYSNAVFNHIIPALGDYTLDKINYNILQEFLIDMFYNGRLDKKGGLSEKSVKDIATILKCTLKSAMNQEKMKQINLNFNYPKSTNKNKMYILTKSEQKKIISYIIENQTSRNLGILISLFTGIRIGELCALQWKDVDLKKGYITINKTLQRVYIKGKNVNISKILITAPKTKNANRDIPLSKDLSNILLKIKNKDDYYVISNNSKYIEPRTYRKYFVKFLNIVKINHINFHALRHTFATNCIRLGVDYKTVSELLGHSNVNITLNLYVHPEMSQKKKCINLLSKDLKNFNF